jgi:hypothetical protein
MAREPISEAFGFLRPAHCFEDDEHADEDFPERDGTTGPQKIDIPRERPLVAPARTVH